MKEYPRCCAVSACGFAITTLPVSQAQAWEQTRLHRLLVIGSERSFLLSLRHSEKQVFPIGRTLFLARRDNLSPSQ